jgi:DNA-binding transcriptional LysR family regulator
LRWPIADRSRQAAARVGRTQSAVSLQIKRLEDSLGQPLFLRTARGVALTPRGEQLMPYARRVVQTLDEAAIALREKPLVGPVRVGIPDEYSGTVLPRALAAFDERHEGVQVSVRVDHSEALLRAMEADELDLAVIYDWAYVQEGEVLCVDPTVWVTSIRHEQHLRRPVPVAVYLQVGLEPGLCRAVAGPPGDRLAPGLELRHDGRLSGGGDQWHGDRARCRAARSRRAAAS